MKKVLIILLINLFTHSSNSTATIEGLYLGLDASYLNLTSQYSELNNMSGRSIGGSLGYRAGKVALEGMQAVFKRQAEILGQAMEEMQSTFKDLSVAGEPQDKVAQQTDLVKGGVEKALGNMRELAEMSGKSNTAAFETIQTRFTESLEEVKAQVLKLKK